MEPISGVLLASVVTFAATNLDDIVLVTLFSTQRVPPRTIIIGQYLGFAGIVAATLAGFLAAVAIPHQWLRFLGLLPLAIGVKYLFQMNKPESKSGSSLGVLSIAAVTLANG